ncbi:TetR/AcrR family transcriptional regulator [Nocardia vaccinii]|uniref:TetR/AcrR family transcriptional regulator n=1 Tax=Nocardia vaccinii TaxID=1822 RepID=UPI00082DBC6C|nr:TetR/AcrR family transcriptional regulator [Nocardia vaccinii]
MPRSSRAQAETHRREVLDAASALVRRDGIDGVTVPEVMAAAGLTHGGFYRHFRSKEDLVAQACSAACAEKERERTDLLEAGPDEYAARRAFLERYLSPTHRDTPAQGCAIAALAGDVARTDVGSPLRAAYLEGLRQMIDGLGRMNPTASEDNRDVLIEIAVMAGAVMLARAAAGDDLSEQILTAARDFLVTGRPADPAPTRPSPETGPAR